MIVEEIKTERAKKTFCTLCDMLDERNWRYEKNQEKLSVSCTAQGDDLPMDIDIRIDIKRELVVLLSHLPFIVAEEKRLDVAVASTVINNKLVDGSFDCDIEDGHMFFRMTSSFVESNLDKEALQYMLFCSCATIDDFNDKLLMVAKNMISLEDFINGEI